MIVNWKVRSSDDSIFYVCVQILIRHHLMLRIVGILYRTVAAVPYFIIFISLLFRCWRTCWSIVELSQVFISIFLNHVFCIVAEPQILNLGFDSTLMFFMLYPLLRPW